MANHGYRISLGVGALLAFFLLASSAHAQLSSVSICQNFFTPQMAVPQGFGAAFDVFSHLQNISIDCTLDQVEVGTGQSNQYVYSSGYIRTASSTSWTPITLRSSSDPVGGWFIGSAYAPLTLSDADFTDWVFVAVYTCTWTGASQAGGWKCGCSDTQCAAHLWQIQAVKKTLTQPLFSTSTQKLIASSSALFQ